MIAPFSCRNDAAAPPETPLICQTLSSSPTVHTNAPFAAMDVAARALRIKTGFFFIRRPSWRMKRRLINKKLCVNAETARKFCAAVLPD